MSIWKKLYQAYEEKNCEKFNQLRKQLSQKEKDSPYFSYYASLKAKICPQQNKKWKILLKWKTIKCPSCWSPLTLSDYNQEQIKKLKNWAKQVVFVCNYCWNSFSYSKTPFKTIFSWYSVWDEININWKNYKLAWAVKYEWTYNEIWDSSWTLEYIEWLAYDDKWEIYYISESRSKDNWWTYDELEISKKTNFPFVIKNTHNSSIETDSWNKNIDEIDEVKVVSLIWELNKWYKIWENVKLRNFWQYNLEEEKGDNSIERNLYKNVFTDKWIINKIPKDFNKIFWNVTFNSLAEKDSILTTSILFPSLLGILGGIFYLIFIKYLIWIENRNLILILSFIFSIWFPLILLKPFSFNSNNYKELKYLLYSISLTAIFWGTLTYYFFGRFPDKYKTKVNRYKNHILPNWNYEYKFNNFIYNTQFVRSYDYGGKKYKQQILQWMYFSINNKKDQEMFKYFINNIEWIFNKLKTPVKFYTCINKNSKNKFLCKNKNIDNNWKSLDYYYNPSYTTISAIIPNIQEDLIVKYHRWFEK